MMRLCISGSLCWALHTAWRLFIGLGVPEHVAKIARHLLSCLPEIWALKFFSFLPSRGCLDASLSLSVL